MAKKEKVVGAEPVVEVNPPVKAEPVIEKKVKAETIKLRASFPAKDKDGYKIKIVFESEGNTVAEALENFKDSETGEAYPKGLVALVNLKVKRGDRELERALSPNKARKILEGKNVVEFENTFRGL